MLACRNIVDLGVGHTLLSSLAAVRSCARCARVSTRGPHRQALAQQLALNKHAVISERLQLMDVEELLEMLQPGALRGPSQCAWNCLVANVSLAEAGDSLISDMLKWSTKRLTLLTRVIFIASQSTHEQQLESCPRAPDRFAAVGENVIAVFDL